MIDPSYNIRVAVADLLSDITSAGEPVPVFDEIVSAVAGFPRIVLLDVSGGGARASKCGFGGDWSQVIKVSTSFTGRVSKNVVEQLCTEVLQRLVPLSGSFIDIGPDFNVWKVEGVIIGTQNYTDGIRQYIDRNIRITYSLTQK
jgi:hypothetical protein